MSSFATGKKIAINGEVWEGLFFFFCFVFLFLLFLFFIFLQIWQHYSRLKQPLSFPYSAVVCFNNDFGVADKNVFPDTQMLGNSAESKKAYAKYGRLNLANAHGWCSAKNRRNKYWGTWLQLDLKETFEICGVATQGGTRPSYRVATFRLLYKNYEEKWRWYLDTDGSVMVILPNFVLQTFIHLHQ